MIQWFPPLTVAMVHRMLYHDSPNSIELGKIAHLQRIFLPQETIGSVAFGLGLMLKHCIKEYLEYDIKILNWFSEISLVAKSFGSDGVGKVASKRRIFRRNAGFMVHRPIWFLFLIIWATIFEETAQVKKDTRVTCHCNLPMFDRIATGINFTRLASHFWLTDKAGFGSQTRHHQLHELTNVFMQISL